MAVSLSSVGTTLKALVSAIALSLMAAPEVGRESNAAKIFLEFPGRTEKVPHSILCFASLKSPCQTESNTCSFC